VLSSWNIRSKSILFVDDCITSGIIAGWCCEIQAALGNHMDGLIWARAGRESNDLIFRGIPGRF